MNDDNGRAPALTLPTSHMFMPRRYRFKEYRSNDKTAARLTLERRIRATPIWLTIDRRDLRADSRSALAQQVHLAMAHMWQQERKQAISRASSRR